MRAVVVSQAMPFPLCMPDAESVPFCVLDIERDWYHGMERVWLARLGKIVKDANSLTISMIYQIISYKLQEPSIPYLCPYQVEAGCPGNETRINSNLSECYKVAFFVMSSCVIAEDNMYKSSLSS